MNERHERFKQTMLAVGARCINECDGPDTQPNTSRLEFWGVPGKGLLVAQLWNDGGVTTYVDWPTGSTWEDLQALLTATENATQTEAQALGALADDTKRDPVGDLAVEIVTTLEKEICGRETAWHDIELHAIVEEIIRRHHAEFNFKP